MDLPIRLISTDFDGTLFAEFDRTPFPLTLQRLLGDLQAQGAKWVINTGRDLPSLLESLARAHVTIHPDALVIVEREIYLHEGARFAPLEAWNERCDRVHAELFQRVAPDLDRLTDWITGRFKVDLYRDAYSPLCFLAGNNKDADDLTAYLEDYAAGIPGLAVVRNDVYARLAHQDFNKGSALSELGRQFGIAAEHTFAAGDHFNDLPMLDLRYAAKLAAPANAMPAVKDAVQRQGGYVSSQVCGYGTERALEFYLSERTAGATGLEKPGGQERSR